MIRNMRWTIPVRLGLAVTLWVVAGCDRNHPLAPDFRPSASLGSGATPAAPSNANAVAASWNQVDVSWQDNSSNESGFEVHRSTTGPSGSFTLLASVGANTTAYSSTSLAGSTEYCYEVRAFRTAGAKTTYSSFSNTACVTTSALPVPAAPSGTDAKPRDSHSVGVTWTDNASNGTGFRLERSLDLGVTWAVADRYDTSNVTSAIDLGRVPEQGVCYRVVAFNSYGDSPPSNVDCTTPPAGPTNLTAAAMDQQSIALSWSDNSAVEDGYEVWRGAGGPWAVVADLPANSTTYRDAGLITNTTYWYQVRAKKDGGYSDSSDPASVGVATDTPAAPSGTTAAPASSSEVGVGWIDNSSNESGFRVERSVDGGGSWATVATAGPWTNSVTDGGRTPEQPVCYRVFAFNSVGDSPPSNTACTAPPLPPSDLAASLVDSQTVDLTWTDNSAVEDGYAVWACAYTYCDCPFDYGCILVTSLPPNSTSFRAAVGYVYFVAATKNGGFSDWVRVNAWWP